MTQQLTRPVPRKTAGGRPKVQSVDRTLDVLEALASRRGATGISELSQLVGLHVSTVHRCAGDPRRPRLRATRSGKFALSSGLARLYAGQRRRRSSRFALGRASVSRTVDAQLRRNGQPRHDERGRSRVSRSSREHAPGKNVHLAGDARAAVLHRQRKSDARVRAPATRNACCAIRSSAVRPKRSRRAPRWRKSWRASASAVSRSTTKRWKKACAASRCRSRSPRRRGRRAFGVRPDHAFDARARRAARAGDLSPGRGTLGAARLRGCRSPIAQRAGEQRVEFGLAGRTGRVGEQTFLSKAPSRSAGMSRLAKPTAATPAGMRAARMSASIRSASASPASAGVASRVSVPSKAAARKWRAGSAGAV